MDLFQTSDEFVDFLAQRDSVFLKTEPEVLDFTSRVGGKLVVMAGADRYEFAINTETIIPVCGLLDATIFDKSVVKRIYAWNFKSFCTYRRFFCKKDFSADITLFDLKTIEGFLNIRNKAPENFGQAVNRLKEVVGKSWQKVYKLIHLPLILETLPSIETTPLLNEKSRKSEHPYYEIEGQANARLNCANKFAHSYLPHTMSPEIRQALKPRGYESRFCTADYRYCEVVVLQWLTGDPVLHSIIESGEDLHRTIYEMVTQDKCDNDKKRNISKLMFLPVMYGCGAKGLAENLKISEDMGKELIKRIQLRFPQATAWMKEQTERAKTEEIVDYFGRPRRFPDGKAFLVRNFLVQATAATVCQEKLIDLERQLRLVESQLAFSVHDGYGIVFPAHQAKAVFETTKSVLQSESKLCPGLQMKAEIKFGSRLDKMKVFWK